MKAQEFYDENLENYNLLNKIDPMTAKQAMQMMEEYHQAKLKLLGMHNVSNCGDYAKNRPDGIKTDEWWCPNSNEVVPSHDVTKLK